MNNKKITQLNYIILKILSNYYIKNNLLMF